ncbi:BamA/TamA family outer membrane protein [Agaribacterium sp. ZY112]|uniref:BamA/TamA family outer membrane protein n=1 Tax=Agaribacterium sp. ZY112 TaxID=3233574 RepID=UPI0035249A3C
MRKHTEVAFLMLFSLYCSVLSAESGDLEKTKHVDQEPSKVNASKKKESPWLATPTLSADPKMGTSIGAMGAYLFKADKKSPTSMLGIMGSYSNTDSTIYGMFSKNYFAADRHRLLAGAFGGRIENDYEDFLGTGFNALTTDRLKGLFLRYTTQVKGDWYLGAQAVDMDYEIDGRDEQTKAFLKAIGLDGFSSNGIGAVVEYDARDNQHSPSSGSYLNLNNTAYREALGGDESFDTYELDFSHFYTHGSKGVLASHVYGRWTNDAPKGAYSSIKLRGYTRGEYLAPNTWTVELEERYPLKGKWGLSGFMGLACLYGDEQSCSDDESLYPAIGGGVTYTLKEQEKMIVRAEIAAGKYKNKGFYIQFGQAF